MLSPKCRRGGVICYGGIIGVRGLRVLSRNRWNKRIHAGSVLLLLAGAAVTLAACGRAGPPEPPPGPLFGSPTAAAAPPPPGAAPLGSSVPPPPPGSAEDVRQKQYAKATQNGFDAYGNPVAPASEKKSFFLDFLLQ
jgi:hypothetical protein